MLADVLLLGERNEDAETDFSVTMVECRLLDIITVRFFFLEKGIPRVPITYLAQPTKATTAGEVGFL